MSPLPGYIRFIVCGACMWRLGQLQELVLFLPLAGVEPWSGLQEVSLPAEPSTGVLHYVSDRLEQ